MSPDTKKPVNVYVPANDGGESELTITAVTPDGRRVGYVPDTRDVIAKYTEAVAAYAKSLEIYANPQAPAEAKQAALTNLQQLEMLLLWINQQRREAGYLTPEETATIQKKQNLANLAEDIDTARQVRGCLPAFFLAFFANFKRHTVVAQLNDPANKLLY